MPVTINAPPKAEAERISKLVSRINNGEIKIPKFQRGFVWKHRNVIALLESLLFGYPVGSLLFWRTEHKLRSERDIAGFSLPQTPEKYPTNYVLDGQQRLTTIYGILSWKGDPSKPHILNVIYDLRGKAFRHRSPEDGAWCLPLNILLEFSKFNAFQKQLAELPDGQQLCEAAETVNETFREYEIPIVTITDRSLEEVCPVFERINSTGMKLTVYDLMVASTYHDDFDLNDEVAKISSTISTRNFEIDGVGIVRAVASVRGTSCKRSSLLTLRSSPPSELRQSLASTKIAIERTIDFLRAEVGVGSSEFLPYEAQITVLARLCSLSAAFSPEQRKLIRSWFWLSSFHERYRGASDNILDTDVTSCHRLLSEGQPLVPFRKFESQDFLSKEFRKGTAVSNAFVALLATQHPKNLLNDAPIDPDGALSWSNRKEFHHIFPRAYLGGRPQAEKDLQNCVLNICLLPSLPNKNISSKRPGIYMRELAEAHGAEKFDEILASNLIPPLRDSGLLEDEYEYFLHARAEYIASILNRLTSMGD